MATVSTVRDAIKTRLATVSGLRCYDTEPDTVLWPCAIVEWLSTDYHQASSGLVRYEFNVLLIAAPMQNGLPIAEHARDAYINTADAASIYKAIEDDDTLGGTVSRCIVRGSRRWNDEDYIGAVFELEAYA
jgi:hypothetical protein